MTDITPEQMIIKLRDAAEQSEYLAVTHKRQLFDAAAAFIENAIKQHSAKPVREASMKFKKVDYKVGEVVSFVLSETDVLALNYQKEWLINLTDRVLGVFSPIPTRVQKDIEVDIAIVTAFIKKHKAYPEQVPEKNFVEEALDRIAARAQREFMADHQACEAQPDNNVEDPTAKADRVVASQIKELSGDDYETVRSYLISHRDYVFEDGKCNEALVALKSLMRKSRDGRDDGMLLPELPENVFLDRLWQPSEKKWRCTLVMHVPVLGSWKQITIPEAHYGLDNPRSAMLAAVAAIGGK